MKVRIIYDEQPNAENFYKEVSVAFNKRDFWGLDSTLAHIIAPAIREFAARFRDDNIVSGHPSNLTPEEYLAVLDEIAYVFEQIRDEYPEHPFVLHSDKTVEELKSDIISYEKRIDNGLLLFAEYYRHLWE